MKGPPARDTYVGGPMILAFVSLAFAGAVDLSGAVGLAPAPWRPLAGEPGLGIGAAYAPADRFAIDLRGLVRVDLSRSPRYGIGEAVLHPRISDDVSPWSAIGSVSAVFVPLDGTVGKRPFQVRLALGTGLVHTVDDLKLLQAEGDPAAEATRSQLHPTIEAGCAVRVAMAGSWSMEVGVRRAGWVEAIDGTELEAKGQWFVTFAPVIHLRANQRRMGDAF